MADFRTLRDRIFEAISEYEYDLKQERDKTRELTDTCAQLAARNADLEDKVKELTTVIEKQLACCPPSEAEKKVIHG